MIPDSVIYLFFLLAFLLELVYLKTMNKKHFLMAVGSIFLGSILVFVNYSDYTIVPFFTLAMFSSLVGDIFMAEKLKMTGERIIDGIIGFTVAHIAYIYAFQQTNYEKYELWYVLTCFVIFPLIYYFLLYNPEIKPLLKIGSFLYSLLLVFLFVTVLRFALTDQVPRNAIFTSVTAVLAFFLSDSILAYNEFKNRVPRAEMFISFTYILAQILFQLTPLLLL